ncbi:outer membrane protein [Qipengyuania sp. 483]
MKSHLYLASILAVAAASPAVAQSDNAGMDSDYFSGPYVSASVNGDFVNDGASERIVFDPNGGTDFQTNLPTVTGGNAFSPGYCAGEALGSQRAQGCGDDDSAISGSIRAGFDTRVGNFAVAGLLVEGTLGGATDYTTGFSTTPASYTFSREVEGSAALRGRLGISPGDGRGLLYATGGVVYGKIDHDFATTNTANAFEVVDGDDWQFGGQIGMGGELMITDNLSFGVEYLHTRYDDDDSYVAVTQGTAPATNPFVLQGGSSNVRLSNTDLNIDSFRATVGFHF